MKQNLTTTPKIEEKPFSSLYLPVNRNHKLNHPSFSQPSQPDIKVWRYIDVPKLLYIIQHKKLYLSRVDTLEDPLEGTIPRYLKERWAKIAHTNFINFHHKSLVEAFGEKEGTSIFEKDFESIKNLANSTDDFAANSRKHLFVNCWHMGNSESEAMWKLYCPLKSGVSIQTTYSKLVSSIEQDSNLYIGLVKYVDYDLDPFEPGIIYEPAMHKRLSFKHESEVRLVKWYFGEPDEPTGPVPETFMVADWDIERCIDAIYVNPYAPQFYYDSIMFLIEKTAPNLLDKVRWSSMKIYSGI